MEGPPSDTWEARGAEESGGMVWGYVPRKFFKNQLRNRVFSVFLQTEMVSSVVLAIKTFD